MRTPIIAGRWYPSDAKQLSAMLEAWRSQEKMLDHPSVLLIPHAGYVYSGPLAAAAYSRLPAQKYARIIILAPSHHALLRRHFSVEPAGTVLTPFGGITFEQGLHDALRELPGAVFQPEAHKLEHSIDIQLPMIRYFLPHCTAGALLVGQWDANEPEDFAAMHAFAEAFRKLLTPSTLIVVSTDFTHYGRDFRYVPFTHNIPANLDRLDSAVFDAFASNNEKAFADILKKTGATVCGASAMQLIMAALPENAVFTRLGRSTSADTTGDWEHCVTYVTASIKADFSEQPKKMAEGQTFQRLSEECGKILLVLARRSLLRAVSGRKEEPLIMSTAVAKELQQLRGAFVTLNKGRHLRGCIGEILPRRALARVVKERAVSAALEDPRFPPVREEEVPDLRIEVSVLTPPKRISSPNEIVLGTHGVILQKQGRAAVFLPQVAPEQGWTVPEMLAHLSLKAGLPADAWKNGAEFQVFTAQVFREE